MKTMAFGRKGICKFQMIKRAILMLNASKTMHMIVWLNQMYHCRWISQPRAVVLGEQYFGRKGLKLTLFAQRPGSEISQGWGTGHWSAINNSDAVIQTPIASKSPDKTRWCCLFLVRRAMKQVIDRTVNPTDSA